MPPNLPGAFLEASLSNPYHNSTENAPGSYCAFLQASLLNPHYKFIENEPGSS